MICTLTWNCRGVRSLETRLHLKEMLRTHHPDILILLETKIHSSGVMNVLVNTEYTNMLAVEASGFVGEIWLLWNCSQVAVEEVSMMDQMLNVIVRKPTGTVWLLSALYASPQVVNRMELWAYLNQLGTIVNIPWLLIGDTNQPLTRNDKFGGRPINRNIADQFQTVLDICNFVDLGFTGPKYTWTNGRTGSALIKERLDRAWGNILWSQAFPHVVVRHLARTTSDHHPVLLQTQTGVP